MNGSAAHREIVTALVARYFFLVRDSHIAAIELVDALLRESISSYVSGRASAQVGVTGLRLHRDIAGDAGRIQSTAAHPIFRFIPNNEVRGAGGALQRAAVTSVEEQPLPSDITGLPRGTTTAGHQHRGSGLHHGSKKQAQARTYQYFFHFIFCCGFVEDHKA